MAKIGDIFKEATGHDPGSCRGIHEIEQMAERVLNRKLEIKRFPSNLVNERGSIFPIDLSERDLDAEIDAELKKMRGLCQE
jgi:hypothetical protein